MFSNSGTSKINLTLIYAHEMGRIADDPNGAALTTPNDLEWRPISAIGFTTGCVGKNGAK
jgi:hypothetical protein